MGNKPVFFDPSGRRQRQFSLAGISIAIISTITVALFVATLVIIPATPDLVLGRYSHLRPYTDKNPAVAHRTERLLRAGRSGTPLGSLVDNSQATRKPLAIGFYVNWDDSSYASLKRALPQLDWVVPSWLSLQGDDMTLSINVDSKALDYIRQNKPQTAILPMLQNATDGNWDGDRLARMLADPGQRAAHIAQIERFLATGQFQGLVIDFESIPPAAHDNLLRFLGELKTVFASHHWTLAVAVPFDDNHWDYAAYAQASDYLMLMAYDEHWEEGRPGSIASQDWFETLLAKRMKQLDPRRVILCLGNYGYDWGKGQSAEDISFQQAMLTARDSESRIEFDADTLNPHFSYEEDDGTVHSVWFLDGVTAFNQISTADEYRPAGYALWRLGSEDPSVLPLLSHTYDEVSSANLAHIDMGEDIDFEGTGEILHVEAQPHAGSRTFSIDPNSELITEQQYTQTPSSYVIRRLGAVPGKVALTFDDGPDPQWTPPILDILKQKKVHASFFIVGSQGEAYPELVQRLYAEGHDIGNHTFTHPNLGESSLKITELELNATQRLVEAQTGHAMHFFRPPYFGDAEPTTADEIVPIEQAQKLGYITVGLRVDPDDWQQPPAATIIERVLAQLREKNPENRGQIVLLHDSGGDRSQTVAALPVLIDMLRSQGYEIVPVSALAGLTREQAMPSVPVDSIGHAADKSVFFAIGWFQHALAWLYRAAIALGLLRLFFLCALALKHRQQRSPLTRQSPPTAERVSVLIPAFNEGKVISSSIQRILESEYPQIEVIVVDDGSTDDTAAVVNAHYGKDPRVQLLSIPNGGKANAVNAGLKLSTGTIVVALDADTQFEKDCITHLVQWFSDPAVGAVAGNAKVGNRINTITRWQALEYITAQNLERRALAVLDCITVVPGAVGAWRRDILDQLGGFPSTTLAEDQDLTIAVQKAGYRVTYDPQAVAWTEAPETVAALAKQRFRWAYGTLQCLWKHRDMLLRRRYGALGMIGLPQAWLFQIAFGLISPLVDFALLWQLASTLLHYLQHPAQPDMTNLAITASYYALFTFVDVAAAMLAFLLEGNEDWSLLWWLVQQRFGYRQIMYYVVIKSVLTAIRGPAVGWGKQDRNASVKMTRQ